MITAVFIENVFLSLKFISLYTLSYIFTCKYEIFYFYPCNMCETKINNLPVDVKIFSFCHTEILFQADFLQWKLYSFLQDDFDHTQFGRFYLGVYVRGLFVLDP